MEPRSIQLCARIRGVYVSCLRINGTATGEPNRNIRDIHPSVRILAEVEIRSRGPNNSFVFEPVKRAIETTGLEM
jgi:hypothetical protein